MKKVFYQVDFHGFNGLHDVSKEFSSVQSIADFLKISYATAWKMAQSIDTKKMSKQVSISRVRKKPIYVTELCV